MKLAVAVLLLTMAVMAADGRPTGDCNCYKKCGRTREGGWCKGFQTCPRLQHLDGGECVCVDDSEMNCTSCHGTKLFGTFPSNVDYCQSYQGCPDPSSMRTCPDGYFEIDNCRCQLDNWDQRKDIVLQGTGTWQAAVDDCLSLGILSKLFTPTSDARLNSIADTVVSAGITGPVWVNSKCNSVGDWSDCPTPVGNLDPTSSASFATSCFEVENDGKPCVAMQFDGNGPVKFFRANCDDSMDYFCNNVY